MILRRTWWLIFLLISPAYALDFTEFFLMNLSAPAYQPSSDPSVPDNPGDKSSPGVAIGGGITLGFKFFKPFDIESGLSYVGRRIHFSSPLKPQTAYELASFEVPLLARFWLSDSISVGAGGFFAHSTGKIISVAGSDVGQTDYTNFRWIRNEMGLITSIRLGTHINELITLIVDGRFLLGLTNNDSTGLGNFQTREFQTCVGLGFDL